MALLGAGEERVATLSRDIAARFGARAVVFADSGTSALRLALTAVQGWQAQSPIALPAYCCYNIATAAVGAGAKVLLYDIDQRTLGPDFESLRGALTQGAGAVVVAHLYGLAVDMARARDLCGQYGALLIEDAAQAAGGRLHGRLLGSWGSVSVLSFGRGKGMTGGGGGALLANDEVGRQVLSAIPVLLPRSGNLGTAVALAAQWALARPAWYGLPSCLPFLKLGETIYHSPWTPRALSKVSAGALSVTLRMAEEEAAVRRGNARRLGRAIASSRFLSAMEVVPDSEPGYLRLPVLVTEPPSSRMRGEGPRSLGIMPAYPRSLPDLEPFRDSCVNRDTPLPGANRLAASLFTVPTHSLLTSNDIEAVEMLISQN
jgi:dTDP-4-amino-4,6-dideoxygalactose transaminase